MTEIFAIPSNVYYWCQNCAPGTTTGVRQVFLVPLEVRLVLLAPLGVRLVLLAPKGVRLELMLFPITKKSLPPFNQILNTVVFAAYKLQ